LEERRAQLDADLNRVSVDTESHAAKPIRRGIGN
jgi:hypothetical protein